MKYKFYGSLHDLIHFVLPNINDILKKDDILYTTTLYKQIINYYNDTFTVNPYCDTGVGDDSDDKYPIDILTMYPTFCNHTINKQLSDNKEVIYDNFILLDEICDNEIESYLDKKIVIFDINTDNAVSLLEHCEIFITSNKNHKDFALISKCKNVILLTNQILDSYDYDYNPFNSNLIISESLYNIKLKFYFFPESEKSILYTTYQNCTYDKEIKLIKKNEMSDMIKFMYFDNEYPLLINTNYVCCGNFEEELINKFSKLVPKNFDICYLYKDDIHNNSIFIINPKKHMSNINYTNVYYLKLLNVTYFNKALIMNGIGDLVMLDYHYDLSLYKYLYIITNNSNASVELIKMTNAYNYDYLVEYDTQKKFNLFNFLSYNNLMQHSIVPVYLKQELLHVDSYSVFDIFPKMELVSKDKIKYKLNYKCTCNTHKIQCQSHIINIKCDISSFKLPDKYVVIAPYTINSPFYCYICKKDHQQICPVNNNGRQYNDIDWNNTIYLINNVFKIPGVIIGTIKIPDKYLVSNIIDLTNKTSIVESFEIVKRAYAYIGIDTCFAVLSSKCLKYNLIKSVNNFRWINQYYNNNINNTIYLFENIPKIYSVV
ncbi:hypothetical protein QKU48_gp0427 [Fadolivirus algeromassiliense]|jgi:hypothetical protein|uniref:Uncharacterized protein n=1 Tax=Fadolivirus FV1/VV64 TaxID=3070911 RepID=A0A7D3QU57_9VIRU|nr:hypothetical protein QKU48_gp0427 [Fadolivirus algeromassiliense]QKF93885.1 hypothetical protein Fadolivirus_1_427 [Fadolivirus FV1/VV64]